MNGQSQKAISKKLFNNPVLERMSHTNSYLVIGTCIFISILVWVYGYVSTELGLTYQVSVFLSGWLFFSFTEYMLHRFVYHSGENYRSEENWQYKIHGVHHDHPDEKDRLAMPLPLVLVLAAAFFGLFYLTLGAYGLYFFPGFLMGYGSYLYVHYLVHTRRPPKNFFAYLWKHHHVHHHQQENRAFGVSSPLWDYLFSTMPVKKRK